MPWSSFFERPFTRRILVVAGLSAAAFAAPILDLFGRNPEVFVANRASAVQIVAFAVVVCLSLPLAAAGLMALAGAVGERSSKWVYITIVTALGFMVGLVVSRQAFPNSTLGSIGVALLVTALVLALHMWMRGLLVLFSLALPIVLALFLTTSGAARLVWIDDTGSGTAESHVGSPAPIVLIQLDEFPTASLMTPEGGINEALFPNFSRLAEEGTWYRNALSNSIATTQSVPAILTGRVGQQGLSPSSIDHPENLFTLLDGVYEMHVIEWVAEMCPEPVCPEFAGRAPARLSALLQDAAVVYGHLSLPPSVREALPSIDNAWKGFLGQRAALKGPGVAVDGLAVPPDQVRAEWINWMQRIANGIGSDDSPTLHYAHLKSPHVPWETNPSGSHYVRPEQYTEVEGVGGDGKWGLSPEPAMLGYQRHLHQVGLLDAVFGILFDRLDETGTWDESMIVVVADHGASFLPGEHRRWPYENNRDDLYRVPMFIKFPGQAEGAVVDEPTFGIDVLPTIVDALDIATEWEFDGVSLLEIEGVDREHEPLRWCCNGSGASTSLDVLFDQVARNRTWIPDQSSWLGVAGVGDGAGLIGDGISTLDIEIDPSFRWSMDTALDWVDKGSGVVQTFVTGRVEVPAGSTSNRILVVINGRVAGVGFVVRDSASGGSIRSLVAEELVRDGPNDVEILVAGASGNWLRGERQEIALEFVTADGRVLELSAEGSRRLQVTEITSSDSGWVVIGWAADINRKEVPDLVHVFAGDTLVASGPPNRDNQNVVQWFGSEDLLRSGFSFDIDSAEIPEGVDHVTVIAEFGSYAIGDVAPMGG